MNEEKMWDIIIVGAGPAGLTAAIYTARGGKRVAVIGDKYDSQLAMSGRLENYPGFEGEGIDLVVKMEEQAKTWGAEVIPARVHDLERHNDIFRANTVDEVYEGRALVIATGASPRRLGIPGEDKLLHRGVSYCAVCDGALFRDKNVLVLGYGNGAAKAAYYLSSFANVKILCTKKALRAEAVYIKGLDERGVDVLEGVDPIEIMGDELVEGIRYRFRGDEITERVDGIFIEAGAAPNNELALKLGLELDERGFVNVDHRCRTSMDGVFACGDITGGIRQVASAVGEGCIVGVSLTTMSSL